jgi:OmpA-OmpF porin, OOP family
MLKKGVIQCAYMAMGFLALGNAAHADVSVVHLGSTVPAAEQVKEGLFPEETCEQLRENGFKCMGFKPAVRFSISNAHFELGSSELPAALKKQLDVFAQVLAARTHVDQPVLITGHADASGTAVLNQALSAERAAAVRNYLVAKGVKPGLLRTSGKGDQHLADSTNPFSSVNRRVEIGRLP